MLKTILNYTWRIALGLAGLAIVAVGITVVAEYYNIKKGQSGYVYSCPEVADGVRVVRMNDHTDRLYRPEQKKYLTPRHAWICENVAEGDSLTVFCPRGGYDRGYLNARTGKVVISPRFERAWVFSEGTAFVIDDGRLAAINPDGSIRFRMPGLFPKKNVVMLDLVYHGGAAPVPDSTGRYGIIDREGNWLVAPAFSEIWPVHGNGWRIVRDGGSYGLMAADLTLSLPVAYSYIEYAADGESVFAFKDGLCQRLSFDGTVLNGCVITDTSDLCYEAYNEELGETRFVTSDQFAAFRVGGRYGILSLKDGSVIIPALYEEVEMVSPSLFAANLEYDRQILFDSRGKRIE